MHLSHASVLAMSNFSILVKIEIDASGHEEEDQFATIQCCSMVQC